jgi:hypothetical protein
MYEVQPTPAGPGLAELNLLLKTFPKVWLMPTGSGGQFYGTEVQWGEESGQNQDRVLQLARKVDVALNMKTPRLFPSCRGPLKLSSDP